MGIAAKGITELMNDSINILIHNRHFEAYHAFGPKKQIKISNDRIDRWAIIDANMSLKSIKIHRFETLNEQILLIQGLHWQNKYHNNI